MNFRKTIRMLAASADFPDPDERRRQSARVEWVKEKVVALEKAQREMDERCMKALDHLSDEEFQRLFEEEQAKVCAILDELNAIRDHDKWPREMHWTV